MHARAMLWSALLVFGSGCPLDDHVWPIAGYGDSITNQPTEWCGLIDALPAGTAWTCETRGISGERAAAGVERLIADLDAGLVEAHYVVLAWGANDIRDDAFGNIIPHILTGIWAVQDAGKVPVLWKVTPRWLPIGGEPEEPDLLRNSVIQKVNAVLELVAEFLELPIVDGYTVLDGRPDLFADDVHPTRGDQGGQAALAASVQWSVAYWELKRKRTN